MRAPDSPPPPPPPRSRHDTRSSGCTAISSCCLGFPTAAKVLKGFKRGWKAKTIYRRPPREGQEGIQLGGQVMASQPSDACCQYPYLNFHSFFFAVLLRSNQGDDVFVWVTLQHTRGHWTHVVLYM